ncbi:hypothetical protein ACHAWF_018670 [Thalassiosira exigua]
MILLPPTPCAYTVRHFSPYETFTEETTAKTSSLTPPAPPPGDTSANEMCTSAAHSLFHPPASSCVNPSSVILARKTIPAGPTALTTAALTFFPATISLSCHVRVRSARDRRAGWKSGSPFRSPIKRSHSSASSACAGGTHHSGNSSEEDELRYSESRERNASRARLAASSFAYTRSRSCNASSPASSSRPKFRRTQSSNPPPAAIPAADAEASHASGRSTGTRRELHSTSSHTTASISRWRSSKLRHRASRTWDKSKAKPGGENADAMRAKAGATEGSDESRAAREAKNSDASTPPMPMPAPPTGQPKAKASATPVPSAPSSTGESSSG